MPLLVGVLDEDNSKDMGIPIVRLGESREIWGENPCFPSPKPTEL
jgi:hypothetical protein